MMRDLYPFSTKDFQAIPLDIIRPLGTARVSFLAGAASTSADIGIANPIMVLRASTPCFVRFGATAEIPTGAVVSDQLYLSDSEVIVVAPASALYSVIGDGAAGVLDIQLIDQWAGLGLDAQYSNT